MNENETTASEAALRIVEAALHSGTIKLRGLLGDSTTSIENGTTVDAQYLSTLLRKLTAAIQQK